MTWPFSDLRPLSYDVIVHGQFTHHAEAHVLATKEGLLALRDAIDAALSQGKAEATVYASDGEGYGIHVERVPYSRLGQPPYLDEIARRLMDREVETLRQFRRYRAPATLAKQEP